MPAERHPRRLRLILAIALLLVTASVQAADPFYLRLLRDGTDAFNRRDFSTATRQLHLACFGLLDEPELLADGLVRLALAQSGAGDGEGFRATFQRLVEIEERFQAYSKATLAPDLRASFEQLLRAEVPEATLLATPGFARVVPTAEQRLAAFPPKERRAELERLGRAEPSQVRWPLLLADLELSQGNAKAARAAADAALSIAPTSADAKRLRGMAYAKEENWARAVEDLSASGAAATDARAAAALLGALTATGAHVRALEVGASLPPAVAGDGAVKAAVQQAEAAKKAAEARPPAPTPAPTKGGATATPAPPPPIATPARPTATATPPRPTPTPTRPAATSTATATPARPAATATRTPKPGRGTGQPLSRAAQAELSRATSLADAGKLDEAFAVAQQVADANPSSKAAQHAAAEIAYRGSRWVEAVAFFDRGGDPGEDQPLRLFYLAVSRYESGDAAGAATALERCLGKIKRSDYVEGYVAKIRGAEGPTS
ncbi:MAG: hypothetical protein AB1625_08220 [Acidobacteriota bacterium]